MCHEEQHTVYTLNDAAFVATDLELLDALGAQNISKIMLLDDIIIENLPPTPVQILSGRNITLIGPGIPQLSGPGPLNTTGSATLDFENLYPVLQVNSNATLILQNLIIKGIPNKYDPSLAAIIETQYARPVGFDLFPSILPQPGSTIILSNVLANTYSATNCTEERLQRVTLQQAQVLGGLDFTGYRADSKTTWVLGWHNLSFGMVSGPLKQNVGDMTMVANGTGWQCLDQPCIGGQPSLEIGGAAVPSSNSDRGNASDSGSNGGISTGVWVAIGVSIALAVFLSVVGTWLVFRRRHRQRCPTPQMLSSSGITKQGGDNYDDEDSMESSEKGVVREDSSISRIKELNKEYQNMAVASALKIRFGNVEGLEIGHLIGRGAHGRIYKGSIRGTPVAVKVVEHTIELGNTAAAENITSEAVLLTALAHPNIVRVFRVATIKLKETSGSFAGSVRLSNEKSTDSTGGPEEVDLEAGSVGADSGNGSVRGNILGVSGPGLYETWLVMEFCEKGSLYGAMKRKKFYTAEGTPNHLIILKLLIDVAEGMEFLHSSPRAVLHGDLKPANILLKAGAEPGSVMAVVADFGLSRMLDSDDKHSIQRTASLGTVQYMSPELLSSGRLTRAADVWAFGIMLIELWHASQLLLEDEAPPQGNAVFVASSPDMAEALSTSGIEEITVLKNVKLANASNTRLPITLSARNITILGLDPAPLYGPGPPKTSNAPTILDFGGLTPAIIIKNGTVLHLKNLILKGIPSKRSPGLKDLQLPFPVGFEVFPAIVPYPNTTVIFENVVITEYLSSCSQPALQQLSLSIASIFGGQQVAGYTEDPPTVWLKGRHTIPITVKAPDDTVLGGMTVISNGVAFACLQDPLTPPGQVPGAALVVTDATGDSAPSRSINLGGEEENPQKSSGSTLSTGAIVGIALGATAAAVAAVIASVLLWRRRQEKHLSAAHKDQFSIEANATASANGNGSTDYINHHGNNNYFTGDDDSGGAGDGDFGSDIKKQRSSIDLYKPNANAAAVQAGYHQLSVASALKIRFGSLDGLEIGHLIGRGAHGRIYKGSIRGSPVAVKVVEHTIEPGNTAACENITSEAVLLTALAHPNIVRVFRVATIKLREAHSGRLSSNSLGTSGDIEIGCGSDDASRLSRDGQLSNNSATTEQQRGNILGVSGPGLYETWLVMEFCEKGSLYGAMKRKKFYTAEGTPNHLVILKLLIDVAEGMEFLHSGPRAVLHGDLKPANILLKAGAEPGSVMAVVADFGLSRMLDSDDKHSIQRTASLGTVQYMSPELLSSGRLTRAADVWAFGIMLIELWHGESAFDEMTAAQIFYSIAQLKQLPKIPLGCPEKYANLIRGCLEYVPEERVNFKDILEQLREILNELSEDNSHV